MSEIKKLLENNKQWAEQVKQESPDFFAELAKGQSPKYLWIGCSDSRVPATQVAGLEPGEMFVHRNIANQVIHTDANCISVLQYAVEVLKVEHIIICGHYACGGVNAALSNNQHGFIDNWLSNIKGSYIRNEAKFSAINSEQERSDLMCEINVLEQVKSVCSTTVVQNAWLREQSLSVHACIYGLEDGLLKELSSAVSSKEQAHSIYQYQS